MKSRTARNSGATFTQLTTVLGRATVSDDLLRVLPFTLLSTLFRLDGEFTIFRGDTGLENYGTLL